MKIWTAVIRTALNRKAVKEHQRFADLFTSPDTIIRPCLQLNGSDPQADCAENAQASEGAMLIPIPAKHFVQSVWWAVLAYGIALKYIIIEFYGKRFTWHRNHDERVYPKQVGKEAVVTGGSRGIGLEIVNNLLQCGYNVVIGSSSSEKSRFNLEQSIQTKYPGCSVEVWHLDLSSLKSVKAFAESYLSKREYLHLLINNGIMFVEQENTEDGHEKHFSVNYLGHCLLTQLLLPMLANSGSKNNNSRIVNCSSCIHYAGDIDVKNFQQRNYYSKYKAYIQSKLAQVMFTYSLQDYLNAKHVNVYVNSVHPGVVNTELMNSVLLIPSLGPLLFKSAKEGAETATYAALSPEMEGVGGKYLEECIIVTSSKISQDVSIQKELWENTWKVLKPWMNDKEYFPSTFDSIAENIIRQ